MTSWPINFEFSQKMTEVLEDVKNNPDKYEFSTDPTKGTSKWLYSNVDDFDCFCYGTINGVEIVAHFQNESMDYPKGMSILK